MTAVLFMNSPLDKLARAAVSYTESTVNVILSQKYL